MKPRLFASLRFLMALALSGLAVVLTCLFLLSGAAVPAQADPGLRYVAPGGNCGGATPCYADIQAAVDAASPGDEIRVAAGTYTGVNVRPRGNLTTAGVITQVVYISKTLTLRGGYTLTDWTTSYPATQTTTLDAFGLGRVLVITGSVGATIENLQITGGRADGLGGPWRDGGGGLYAFSSTVTLDNNQVFSNTADMGGGVLLDHSTGSLNGNTVWGNQGIDGVSLYAGVLTLTGNTITGNAGTGVAARQRYDDYGAELVLAGNVIADNQGWAVDTYGKGTTGRRKSTYHLNMGQSAGNTGVLRSRLDIEW